VVDVLDWPSRYCTWRPASASLISSGWSELKKNGLLFGVSLASALGLTILMREPQFSDSQTYVLFLLFFSIGLWLTEAIPPFSVGLFILAFLAFSLGNGRFNSEPQDITQYLHTFSSGVIWLMLGGFLLASALTKTGLDQKLFLFTLRIAGTTPRRILLGLMVTTMFASMLMSNTATTAMVVASTTPLLTRLGKDAGLARALLVGIPLSASVGGMGTIIGSPPNVIAAGALENAGLEIDFLRWMMYGIPLAVFLSAVGYFALARIFIKDNEPLPVDLLEQGGVEDPAAASRSNKAVVMIVLGVTLLLWMTTSLHHLSVSAVAAIPIVFLTMTGVLEAEDIRGLPWDTLLLVAGGLSLGLALQQTGLLDHYAQRIVALPIEPLAFLGIFAFATMLFSNVMSHTATSTVLVPLGMAILPAYRTPMALIIGLAASSAMFLPVSTPPNAIAYSTGLVDQKDFRIGGTLIGVLGPAAAVAWVLLWT
jgi:solute carrier family 13 (sodium-dependent dicarboxylate transporter), member 2/3/5